MIDSRQCSCEVAVSYSLCISKQPFMALLLMILMVVLSAASRSRNIVFSMHILTLISSIHCIPAHSYVVLYVMQKDQHHFLQAGLVMGKPANQVKCSNLSWDSVPMSLFVFLQISMSFPSASNRSLFRRSALCLRAIDDY